MKCVLFSLILMMIVLVGCEEMFINRGDLTDVKEGVITLSAQVDAGQALWTEVANITGKNIEETAAINKKIDEYQPVFEDAAIALAEAPTLIEGLRDANQKTAVVNPYVGIIDLVLTLVGGAVIGGGGGAVVVKSVKTKLKKENIVLKKKYSAEKKGLEAIRIKHPESYEENYALVGGLREKVGV